MHDSCDQRGSTELSETQESRVASGVQTGKGEVGEASGEGCGARRGAGLALPAYGFQSLF